LLNVIDPPHSNQIASGGIRTDELTQAQFLLDPADDAFTPAEASALVAGLAHA
jgi:hypothetical protein